MINDLSTSLAQIPGLNQSVPAPQAAGLTSDFDTFLKMLTAQVKYQDPLEPIDSTEYASQLAQFSMVEQQVKTNQSLTAVFDQLSSSNISTLASWVGMEARAVTPAHFDGSPITITPNPASIAERADLVVLDADGKEVQRSVIPVSSDQFEWAGVDDDGAPFSTGTYSFVVESYQDGQLILSEPAAVYAKVAEAQIRGGQIVLILEGGQAIESSSVTGLRAAN